VVVPAVVLMAQAVLFVLRLSGFPIMWCVPSQNKEKETADSGAGRWCLFRSFSVWSWRL
jgi:hypothetical protein